MVAVDPDYCPRCGTRLEDRAVHGRERPFCRDCERPVFRNAVPSAGVVVRDDAADEPRPLLIERATPPVGVWAVPGGHPEYDEDPADAAARELAEETGPRCAPDDLELLTVVRSDDPEGTPYLMVTYTVDRSVTEGPLDTGPEASDARFWSLAEMLERTEQTRAIDRRRAPLAFGNGDDG